MPKKVVVECVTCGWTVVGKMPDPDMPGNKIVITDELEIAIKAHHKETVGVLGVNGHRDYDVSERGNIIGTIEGRSYQVLFAPKERWSRGIERE